jgi:hypothetical protein
MVSILVHYCNWGVVTMLLLSPDFGTRIIILLEIIVSSTVLLIYVVLHFTLKIIRISRLKRGTHSIKKPNL